LFWERSAELEAAGALVVHSMKKPSTFELAEEGLCYVVVAADATMTNENCPGTYGVQTVMLSGFFARAALRRRM